MNIRTRRLFHIDPCCCCCCCCGWSFCWTLFPAVPFWSWLLVCCSFLSHAAASSLRSVAMMKRKDEKIARVTTPITWRTGDTATRSRDHAGIPDKPAREPAKNRLRVYCVAKSYLFSFYTSLPLFWVLSISLQKSSRKWKHSYGTELRPSYVLSKMLENWHFWSNRQAKYQDFRSTAKYKANWITKAGVIKCSLRAVSTGFFSTCMSKQVHFAPCKLNFKLQTSIKQTF